MLPFYRCTIGFCCALAWPQPGHRPGYQLAGWLGALQISLIACLLDSAAAPECFLLSTRTLCVCFVTGFLVRRAMCGLTRIIKKATLPMFLNLSCLSSQPARLVCPVCPMPQAEHAGLRHSGHHLPPPLSSLQPVVRRAGCAAAGPAAAHCQGPWGLPSAGGLFGGADGGGDLSS